ncbi:MAG: YdeI/OmpD-associated family protein [Flavisolibacter sp.]
MPQATTAKKLRIKEGNLLRTIHAPGNFRSLLGPLPEGVRISATAGNFHQVHWFVKDQAHLHKEWPMVQSLLKEGVLCWIYFPKGSSGIQSDLSRDRGWDELKNVPELQWISLVSLDLTWSAFGLRLKQGKIKKKAPEEKAILQYIDAGKKTLRLPEDFAAALESNGKAENFFHGLSFTNRKEYVEWIISAKKEATRNTRLDASIERLSNGWKSPDNRS